MPKYKSIDWTLQRVGYLHDVAKKIFNNLNDNEKNIVSKVLENELREKEPEMHESERKRLWPLKKYLLLAHYIPVFLRIIYKKINEAKAQGRAPLCKSTVYIDPYSGPGLSLMSSDLNDLIIGSPIIALVWPDYVRQNTEHYKSLNPFFDHYIFNEYDPNRCKALKIVVEKTLDIVIRPRHVAIQLRYDIHSVDANACIYNALEVVQRDDSCTLLFIDPPGSLRAQPSFKALSSIVESAPCCDAIILFHHIYIARSICKEDVEPRLVEQVFGPLSDKALNIARSENVENIASTLANIYRETLYKAGFGTVYMYEITYQGKRPLYRLFLCSKKKNASWLENIDKWIHNVGFLDMDYETVYRLLKGHRTLFDYPLKHTPKMNR